MSSCVILRYIIDAEEAVLWSRVFYARTRWHVPETRKVPLSLKRLRVNKGKQSGSDAAEMVELGFSPPHVSATSSISTSVQPLTFVHLALGAITTVRNKGLETIVGRNEMSVARTPGHMTPGRRRNANKENVYFEPGKKGRKTGITVPDRGIRDEHGFEPVSGLFSSPVKDAPAHRTRSSMAAEGSGTLQAQRTPRMPPPRAQTPRHTNIGGSPVRHSSIKRGTPTRVFRDETPTREQAEAVRSVEREPSPASVIMTTHAKKPGPRKSIFDINMSPYKRTPIAASSPPQGAIDELSRVLDTNDYDALDMAPPELNDSLPAVTDDTRNDPFPRQHDEPNTSRKRGARRSDPTMVDQEGDKTQLSSTSWPSMKRRRTTVGSSQIDESPSQNTRSSARNARGPYFHNIAPEAQMTAGMDHVPAIEDDAQDYEQHEAHEGETEGQEQVEPSVVIFRHEDDDKAETESASPARARGRRSRKSLTLPSARRRAALNLQAKESRSAQEKAAGDSGSKEVTGSPDHPENDDDDDDDDDSESDSDDPYAARIGAIRLRSATPHEDEGARITRSGRASIKPLAYWKNETYVYRRGKIDGVIRAEEIEQPKRRVRRRKQGRQPARRMSTIGEESDGGGEEVQHPDLLPEQWEFENDGVIQGPVREWDRVLETSGEGEVVEEIAFAASSIETLEGDGGTFRYAKMLNIPFFGAGIVELGPGGSKKSKNSRKMTFVFFVHEGKVTVDVAGMCFGITQGGMFHVPRGNNYAIQNESTIFPAKIFYAQGNEVAVANVTAAAATATATTAEQVMESKETA